MLKRGRCNVYPQVSFTPGTLWTFPQHSSDQYLVPRHVGLQVSTLRTCGLSPRWLQPYVLWRVRCHHVMSAKEWACKRQTDRPQDSSNAIAYLYSLYFYLCLCQDVVECYLCSRYHHIRIAMNCGYLNQSSLHPKKTLWKSTNSLLRGPSGLVGLWVWTALSTRRCHTKPRLQICESARAEKSRRLLSAKKWEPSALLQNLQLKLAAVELVRSSDKTLSKDVISGAPNKLKSSNSTSTCAQKLCYCSSNNKCNQHIK